MSYEHDVDSSSFGFPRDLIYRLSRLPSSSELYSKECAVFISLVPRTKLPAFHLSKLHVLLEVNDRL